MLPIGEEGLKPICFYMVVNVNHALSNSVIWEFIYFCYCISEGFQRTCLVLLKVDAICIEICNPKLAQRNKSSSLSLTLFNGTFLCNSNLLAIDVISVLYANN